MVPSHVRKNGTTQQRREAKRKDPHHTYTEMRAQDRLAQKKRTNEITQYRDRSPSHLHRDEGPGSASPRNEKQKRNNAIDPHRIYTEMRAQDLLALETKNKNAITQ